MSSHRFEYLRVHSEIKPYIWIFTIHKEIDQKDENDRKMKKLLLEIKLRDNESNFSIFK